MVRPKLIVFASGTKTGDGSGFENLVRASRTGELGADITAVVSTREHGGVRERAERLSVSFLHFPGPYDAEGYQRIVHASGAEWVALSGWPKLVRGLDPAQTFNIHPALLSFDNGRFGGLGMYGRHIHEAVSRAIEAGETVESGCTMHFVTDEYDRGPVFFEYRLPLAKGLMIETIAAVISTIEHEWQPRITNMVVRGDIRWDGEDTASLVVPEGYHYLPKR